MVYERVRWIVIPGDGGSIYGTGSPSFISNGGSHFDIYAKDAIDGRITKIQWDKPTTAQAPPIQAGSVEITISGTAEAVLTLKNALNTTWTRYIRTPIHDIVGAVFGASTATGSNYPANIVCRDSIIRVVGSGMGIQTGSCGGTFKVFYY